MADEEWVKAPEFVPRCFSAPKEENNDHRMHKRLCPYAERDGICKYPVGECHYLHGDLCELCARPALHPFNEELRKKHTQVNI